MLKKSRSYALATAALAAVFIALSPMTAPSAFAQAAPAQPKKTPLQIEAEAAYNLANEKKYPEAIVAFKALKNGKWKEWLESNNMTSAIDYQIAACLIAQKNWTAAEAELKSFIEKYPKDPQLTDVRLALVNCYIQQERWEDARVAVDAILKWLERNPNPGLAIKATLARVDLLQREGAAMDKSGKKPPDGVESWEKLALATSAQNLYKLTNNNINSAEMIEARQKLINIYRKLGRIGEANALKAKVDAYISGKGGALDPASLIRSNMQNLEVGDDYFGQAQDIDVEMASDEEFARRQELFRQALQIYQGVMRKDALMKCFAPALEMSKAAVETAKKQGGETPDEKAQEKIDKAEEELAQIEEYKTAFDENKDFDALISFRIGASLISLDRFWEAYVAFGDILQNHKDFDLLSTATYYYILTLRAMGRDDEAQAECKKFIDTFKDNKEKGDELGRVALLLGQISYDKGDYKDAIAQLEWVKKNVSKLPLDVNCQIDWFIIAANFSRCPWGILNDEEKEYIKGMGKPGYKPKLSAESQNTLSLIDSFLEKYQKNTDFAPVVEEMLYRRALLFFYSTMLPETKAAFEVYVDKYPEGQFIPDARYRLAVVQNGIRPPQTQDVVSRCTNWIKDYFDVDDKTVLNSLAVPKLRDDVSVNIADSVAYQLPEVYTLLGDANKSLAEAVKGSETRKGIGNKKIAKFTQSDLRKKQKYMDASVDAYILAAKTARYNPDALYFSLNELDKQLPQLEGGYARLLDLYNTLYNWDPSSPEALGYLFKKVDYTVRKARAEAQKMPQPERLAHIAKAQDETRKIMAEAILKNINDPRQDGVETLIDDLASRFADKVKKHPAPKEGEVPKPRDPDEYTVEKAVADMKTLLKLTGDTPASLVARARGLYAESVIYDNLAFLNARRNAPESNRLASKRDDLYRSLASQHKPDELSPMILSKVGAYLLDRGDTKKAEEFFQYVLDFYKGSESAEFSFEGEGRILLDRKEYKKAYEIFNEAIEGNVAYMLEPDLRLGRAQSLILMSDADASALNIADRFENATTELNYIKSIKEWRGRPTAAALYYLGQVKEMKAAKEKDRTKREDLYKSAIGDYRICYLTWKKYPEFAAKAMLRTGIVFKDFLKRPSDGVNPSDSEAAKLLFLQMTEPTSRYKDTPEGKEAAKLLQTM
ncbi:MAG: tetratricopeptide repeat protein [Opitutales bacterium]|nr:tetratricopeptide repeat protein [Opitutales bacterium]